MTSTGDSSAGREPNRKFIAARQALPSPTVPGYCMSRGELAEAVNAHLWGKTGEACGALDGQAIGRYERGEIRWPHARYRAAFRAVLGASRDEELGFDPRHLDRVIAARVPLDQAGGR